MKKKAISFLKMHGAGNDFVFLTPERLGRPMTSSLAKKLLDRHFGVGGDQLLFLKKQKGRYPYQLDFYNSDGSQAEMCGNGTRAVAFYLNKFEKVKKSFHLLTKAGPIGILYSPQGIDVDMGEPILEGKLIPVQSAGDILDYPIKIKDQTVIVNCVSMGNPHAVIFVKDVDTYPVELVGPQVEHHPFFPKRVNVEFVEVQSPTQVKARVWERGAGETLACGTGACAIAVASVRKNKTQRQVKINLPGGQLRVQWAENNHVFLSGPAEVSFEGRFYV